MTAMNSKANNCNMEIQRTRRPAARGDARLWQLVLAAGTVALGGCSLPRGNAFIPPAPTAVVARAESAPPAALQDDVETVLKKMEAVYDEVKDYKTEVETIIFEKDGSFKTEKSVYTFKKPKWIRLDFVSPHPGMIMVYPDRDGKVLVKPGGLLSKLRFHLMLDDPLLETPSGQRMNQTDLGLLIKNIRHSVTDQRRGPVSISEDKDTIQIQVLADDHFREGVETRYRFLISKELWLPVEVGRSTTNDVQDGRIIFRNLRTNINVSDDLFQ
jgi:outer membrane lipoprotein-sorting protein